MLRTPGGEEGEVGFRGGPSSRGLWASGGKNSSCLNNSGKRHAALPLPPVLFSTSLFGHLQWQLSSRRYGEGDAGGKLFQKERESRRPGALGPAQGLLPTWHRTRAPGRCGPWWREAAAS